MSCLEPRKKKLKFNEPTTRFAVIDPILRVLCETLHTKLILEESVSVDEDNTYHLSERNKADYSLFYLETECLQVLILEAKTNKSKTLHSICQTIGYFLASESAKCSPLAMVVTEDTAQFCFFPLHGW